MQDADESLQEPSQEVSQLRSTGQLWSAAEQGAVPEGGETPVARAGADLPAEADPDLLLHAIQKREQRSFALKLSGILGGLALAAYLAGSGNGAILQSVIHVSVGAAAGAAGALAWKRRGPRSGS